MGALDITILVILAYGAFKGFLKGIIKEVAGIIGIILGIILSVKFADVTAGYLKEYFNVSGALSKPAAFIITFILTIVVISILASLTDKFFKTLGLSFLIKISGSILGALKMLLITGVFLTLLLKLNSKMETPFMDTKPLQESPLSQASMFVAELVLPQDFVPDLPEIPEDAKPLTR